MRVIPSLSDDQTGTLQAAVVVPLYNETVETVVPTLEAVAVQEDVEALRWAVVLVFNNAADAPEQVIAVNRDTHAQLHALLHPDVALDPAHPLHRLHGRTLFVDAYSPGHAPSVCNVGVARQLGADVAMQLLQEDGLMHCTDADTRLGPKHISSGRQFFAAHPDIAAATGPVEYRCDTPEETAAVQLDRLFWRLRVLRRKLQSPGEDGPKRQRVQLMSGCNMVVRKRAFPGFQPIAGGEDTRLSMDIIRGGGEIGFSQGFAVQTSSRFSQRTHEQHGAGQWLKRRADMLSDVMAAPVPSVDQTEWADDLLTYLDDCMRFLPDREAWRNHLLRFRSSAPNASHRLTTAEVDELWQFVALLPQHVSAASNGFLFRMAERFSEAEDRFARTTMGEALQEYETAIRAEAERDSNPFVATALDLAGVEFSMMEVIERPYFEGKGLQSLHGVRKAHWSVRLLETVGRLAQQWRTLHAGIAMARDDDAQYAAPLQAVSDGMTYYACAKLLVERVNEFVEHGGDARHPQLFSHIDFYIDQLAGMTELSPRIARMNAGLLERCKQALVSRRPGPNPNALELAISVASGLANSMAGAVREWNTDDPSAQEDAVGPNVPLP